MSIDMSNIAAGRTSTEFRSILTGRRVAVTRRREPDQAEVRQLPPIKRASSLLSGRLPSRPEIVAGLLHRGSTMVYGGASKTNKTFAMMDMAVSVAGGKPWWNLNTTQGKVLYVDFELPEDFFSDRLDRIITAKSLQPDVIEHLDVWNLRGYAADLTLLAPQISERIKDTPYSLIIIDPIYKVLGRRDENSAGDVNSLLNELDGIAKESNAAIVVGHHFSKGNKSKTDSKDRISGSGVFARSPDAIVTITPHEKEDVYTVETTLRHHKRMEPFCVRWNYPLMERCEDEDPTKLKGGGGKTEQFRPELLLPFLEDEPLITAKWEEKACDALKMSPRTFSGKKLKLVADKKVILGEDKKWRISTVGKPWLKQASYNEVQGAEGAIAPLAA